MGCIHPHKQESWPYPRAQVAFTHLPSGGMLPEIANQETFP